MIIGLEQGQVDVIKDWGILRTKAHHEYGGEYDNSNQNNWVGGVINRHLVFNKNVVQKGYQRNYL